MDLYRALQDTERYIAELAVSGAAGDDDADADVAGRGGADAGGGDAASDGAGRRQILPEGVMRYAPPPPTPKAVSTAQYLQAAGGVGAECAAPAWLSAWQASGRWLSAWQASRRWLHVL